MGIPKMWLKNIYSGGARKRPFALN